jgi:hypothetical protein
MGYAASSSGGAGFGVCTSYFMISPSRFIGRMTGQLHYLQPSIFSTYFFPAIRGDLWIHERCRMVPCPTKTLVVFWAEDSVGGRAWAREVHPPTLLTINAQKRYPQGTELCLEGFVLGRQFLRCGGKKSLLLGFGDFMRSRRMELPSDVT